MKTIYYNGKVYLNDKFAVAFEVEDGKFSKIFEKESDFNLDDYKKRFDLEQKLVMPSLIDAHCHFLLTARAINKFNFDVIDTQEKLVARIKEHIQFHDHSNDVCLEGYKTQKFGRIDRHFLDSITKVKALFVFEFDYHSVILNTKALEKIGLFNQYVINRENGLIELGEDGFPNGVLKESAINEVRNYLNKIGSNKEYKKMDFLQYKLIKMGIGSIATCDLQDIHFNLVLDQYDQFENYRKIDIVHQCPLTNMGHLRGMINKVKLDPLTKNNAQIKLFLDGSVNSRTAALSDYYIGTNDMGHLNFEYGTLKDVVTEINNNGLQVVAHCIGDRAAYLCAKVFYDIDNTNKHRNTIIHCQLTNKKLIELIKSGNIYVNANPVFIEDDLNVLKDYIPNEILQDSYAFKTMYDMGIEVSFGTDAPVCDFDPWKNIYYAISNKQLNPPYLEWNQRENFTLKEAIDCYTYRAAKMIHKENEIGKIAVGYNANFIVLNQNIFELKNKTDILNTVVLYNFHEGINILVDEYYY